MIENHSRADGGLDLGMYFTHPAVYLDHGALGDILDDDARTARLVRALTSKGGTFCFSWVGLYEFCRTSELTADRAQALIESFFPRLFFVELNPWVVIDRENALLDGGPPHAPHADMEFVKALIGLAKEPSEHISVKGLFSAVRERSAEYEVGRLTAAFIDGIKKVRADVQSRPELRALAAKVPAGPGLPCGTRFLLPEVLRVFVRTADRDPTHNDAIDFFHTVVPVSYADHVILDAHWATQARQAVARLRRAGHRGHFAQIFGGKGNGVDALLNGLES